MTDKRVLGLIATTVVIVGFVGCNPTSSINNVDGDRFDTTEWVPVGLPQDGKVPVDNVTDYESEATTDDETLHGEESDEDDNSEENETTIQNDNSAAPAVERPETKILQTALKKEKNKSSGINKKTAMQLLPLLLIPLMIQAQLIPMMLFKLKMMALKALMVGKAALIIVLINVLRNAFIGADSMEEQYEQQSLASSHYGYSGGPEYGAWINKRRRVFFVPSTSEETFPANSDPYGGHQHFRSDLPDDDHLSVKNQIRGRQ
ncbi:Hypothetical protein NTJ_05572 [Nesidiocoris tenuis]|uniref:Uncharacterized protein n=1 Tax=Nesidiocoris tenuis TaxID=355587 RepID=A0ABN7AKK6_9HEMI|nr:Hypothetical protein NTJ_05572 [Nesidiocoris tenuis]